jgi:hypothetical protein
LAGLGAGTAGGQAVINIKIFCFVPIVWNIFAWSAFFLQCRFYILYAPTYQGIALIWWGRGGKAVGIDAAAGFLLGANTTMHCMDQNVAVDVLCCLCVARVYFPQQAGTYQHETALPTAQALYVVSMHV